MLIDDVAQKCEALLAEFALDAALHRLPGSFLGLHGDEHHAPPGPGQRWGCHPYGKEHFPTPRESCSFSAESAQNAKEQLAETVAPKQGDEGGKGLGLLI